MPKKINGLPIAVIIALVVAIGVSSHHAHSEPVKVPDAANERFSVTVTGSGPDVILIPGLASSAATWDGTVAKFKGQYRLHVLNLAGFAGEPAGANATGDILPAEVEAIDTYIKATHLKAPIVVGHSLGGLLGLMLAKAHPEDTGKLVIVDALPFVGVIFNPAATVDAVRPQALAIRAGTEQMPADTFKAQQTMGVARLVTSPENQKTVLEWSLTSDRHVLAQAFYEDLTTDLRSDIATIKTPTVVLYPVEPGATQATTEPVYRLSYTGMPNVSFAPVADSRHFEMLDQPEAFATALAAALK